MIRNAIDILRDTLSKIERAKGVTPDDPAIIKVRRKIVGMIIQLQTAKESKSKDWVS